MSTAIAAAILPIWFWVLRTFVCEPIERWCHRNLSKERAEFWTKQRPAFLYKNRGDK